MKTNALCLVTALIIGASGSVAGAATVYTSRTAWESACPVYDEEFFTDATLNSGVSVVTDLGYVDTVKGVWWDRLIVPDEPDGPTTTTWYFDSPMTGFGAYWNPAEPGGPGASIRMYLNGNQVGQEISRDMAGGFWGVTNSPFDEVLLTSGSSSGWCETYELDNMVYGIPEPGALALLAVGALALLKRKRRS